MPKSLSDPADGHTRPDVLITEARRFRMTTLSDEAFEIVDRLTDMLEAATGGMHVDAKHWAELSRLRVAHKKLDADYNEALAREADLRAQVAQSNTPVTDEMVAEAVREFFYPEPHVHGVRVRFDVSAFDAAIERVAATAAEMIDAALEPRAWRDRHGDVWVLGEDGLMHSRETAPFPREHVEKKWGPLIAEPDVSEEADRG